ncbi:MAG: HlyD family efflux transporter periplasmic adaptor subunit [Defluviitaleaceae bacterium]|nr:HlyD family efflux transporter periplasmic adaptor subunit [Defluviitaleaceae bacterium]
MKNKKKLIIIVAAVLVVGVGIFVLASPNIGQGEPTGPNVAVAPVSRSTLESNVTAQGEVLMLGTGNVAFINNTLEVSEILVSENDVVEEGQPLITFNTQMLERTRQRDALLHQLHDTQLMLQSQRVQVESMRLGPTNIEIENANFNISRARQGILDAYFAQEQIETSVTLQEISIGLIQTNLLDAANTFLNTQTLFNIGAATQVQLDNATRAVENLEVELRSAQENLITLGNQRIQATQNITAAYDNLRLAEIQLEDLQNRVTSPQNQNAIAQQEIAIQRTQLAIQDINRNIDNLDDVEEVLFSPVAGTVTAINVVAGGMAAQGSPLVQISDVDDYVVRAFINQLHAGQLSIGQNVTIEGSILGNQVLQGRIYSISTIATTQAIAGIMERVIPIEITVDSQDTDLLIPGVTLDITVTTDVRENVIAIPLLSTLIDPAGSSFVFVVAGDNTIEQRFVDVITYAEMYIEVTGLEEGELIVLQPLPTMESGMLITPIGG